MTDRPAALPGNLLRPWSAAGPPEQELLQCEAHTLHPAHRFPTQPSSPCIIIRCRPASCPSSRSMDVFCTLQSPPRRSHPPPSTCRRADARRPGARVAHHRHRQPDRCAALPGGTHRQVRLACFVRACLPACSCLRACLFWWVSLRLGLQVLGRVDLQGGCCWLDADAPPGDHSVCRFSTRPAGWTPHLTSL